MYLVLYRSFAFVLIIPCMASHSLPASCCSPRLCTYARTPRFFFLLATSLEICISTSLLLFFFFNLHVASLNSSNLMSSPLYNCFIRTCPVRIFTSPLYARAALQLVRLFFMWGCLAIFLLSPSKSPLASFFSYMSSSLQILPLCEDSSLFTPL